MNNRYLYRAKRIDNGEWVEGLLTIMWGQLHIIVPEDENTAYPIDESTICQCTGLKDKNGKLIWENDFMIGYLDDIYQEDATYVRVMWRNNGFRTHQNGYDDFEILDEFDQNNFEVCGNIFDNPELLELD
ncbi:MAG: YopX family protein [Blautia obeum]|nr:YopX family protein [Blautia obeum]